jgi:hypothetical protein
MSASRGAPLKLAWIEKTWLPDGSDVFGNWVVTFSGHAFNPTRAVGVRLANTPLGSGGSVASPYASSHATAAAWACNEIGKSLNLFADAIGTRVICGARGDLHDMSRHYLATVKS